MIKPILLFLSLLIAGVSTAQTPADLTKSIDSLVSPQFTGNQPGVSILIAQKGQIVYEKTFTPAPTRLHSIKVRLPSTKKITSFISTFLMAPENI